MQYKNLDFYKPGEDDVVLVTGGTGLLGSAVVRELAGRGWNVAFQYNSNEKKAKALIAELKSGKKIKCFAADLTNKKDIAALIAAVKKEFTTIHAFVHCSAPILEESKLDEKSIDIFTKMNEVHVNPFIKIVEHLAPEMKLRQNGTVVGILTEAIMPGKRIASWSAYAASKMALASYLTDLASEFNPLGLRVVGLLPGAIKEESETKSENRWNLSITPNDVAKTIGDILEDRNKFKNGSFFSLTPLEGLKDVSQFGFFSPQARVVREVGERKAVVLSSNNGETRAQLEDIFRKVFELDEGESLDDARLGSWAKWDSLGHIDLLMNVEQAMEIRFLDQDIPALISFKSILEAVERQKVHGV